MLQVSESVLVVPEEHAEVSRDRFRAVSGRLNSHIDSQPRQTAELRDFDLPHVTCVLSHLAVTVVLERDGPGKTGAGARCGGRARDRDVVDEGQRLESHLHL